MTEQTFVSLVFIVGLAVALWRLLRMFKAMRSTKSTSEHIADLRLEIAANTRWLHASKEKFLKLRRRHNLRD